MSIPPRTVSAPNTNAPFRSSYGSAPLMSRGPDHTRAAPPPSLPMPGSGAGAFKASLRPPTAASPAAAAASPTPAAPALTSPVLSSSVASPTPSTTPQLLPRDGDAKPRTLAEIDPVWAEAMSTAKDEAGEKFMLWAKSLWDSLHLDGKPAHLCDNRSDGPFKGLPAGQAKRHLLVKERTLPHQVMGILSRVTPDNYDAIEVELTNLPIRQSEDEEIQEIINVFFKKAIRPEDSIYAPQYARLITALVRNIEQQEAEKLQRDQAAGREPDSGPVVSKLIRSAVVNKCRQQYENLPELAELQAAVQTGDDDPETEGRRRELMAKLKANIGFLGQLFLNKLVVERVVTAVLYFLLWGQDGQGQASHDYEVEQFTTLLEVCGPHLSADMRNTYQSSYISTLNDISNSSAVTMRTKVLAMNCREMIENNYVRRGRKTGPMKIDDYNKQAAARQVEEFEKVKRTLEQNAQLQQQQQQQHQMHNPHTRSALRGRGPFSPTTNNTPAYRPHPAHQQQQQQQQQAQPQPPKLTTVEEFNQMIEAVAKGHVDSEFRSTIILPDLTVPKGSLVTYFAEAVFRYIASRRWEKERRAAGPILQAALDGGILTAPQIKEISKAITDRCVASDVPIVFDMLLEFYDSAPSLFGFSAMNALLRDIFSRSPSCAFSVLTRVVDAVSKRGPERLERPKEKESASTSRLSTPVAAGGEFPTHTSSRVHLLPHVLRFVGYTWTRQRPADAPADAADADDDGEDDEMLVAERESHDVVEYICNHTMASSETSVPDVALATYTHLLMNCQVTEDGISAPNLNSKDATARVQALLPSDLAIRQLGNRWTARKFLSAVFIYARFNKALLKMLLSIVSKPLFEKVTVQDCGALFIDLYETWIELDRKPAAALDTALSTILAGLPSTLSSSTAVDRLFDTISANRDTDAIPATFQQFRKGSQK